MRNSKMKRDELKNIIQEVIEEAKKM